MAGVLPQQKISKAEKNDKWFQDNITYRIDQSNYWSSDRWEIIHLYKAASGILDKSAYKSVLNPYNTEGENLSNFPAEMRNMDIISPILNSYLGERANKPFNFNCIVSNPDSPNKVKDSQDNAFMAALAQHYVNGLNQSGVQTGVDSKEVPAFQKIADNYQVDNSDKRALFGQEALDYLKHDLQLRDKYQENFYDWLVTGRCYTYKDVFKDDVFHEVCPPLEMWHGTTRTGFIEDCDWVIRRSRYNLSQVIDRFHEVLTPAEIDTLETKFRTGAGSSTVNLSFNTITPSIDKAANVSYSTTGNLNADLVDVWHIVWKGYKKIGILKYRDELGQEQETEVSEEYELDESNNDISLEWLYNSCVYEGYRIDNDMYKYCRELQVQRNQLSNASIVKLPYNGRVGYNERGTVKSIVKQCLDYQALYNIYHFRRALTLARNKDKLMIMPIGLIPDEFGNDANGMAKYLHFAETTGFAFFDEQKQGAAQVLQAIKSVDLSLGNYIAEMTQVIQGIKDELWDAVGMNRQRYGDVNSSDGKGTTEQAIFRSAVITRELNRRFEKFQESDIQGLIDYSKVAWINGKKGMYINSEGRKAFLEVNPDEHLDTDYGIFAVDSQEEEDKLNKAKDYAFGWAQKSSNSVDVVLEILDSNNMSSLKAKAKKAEQVEKEYQDSIRQQEAQNAQTLQDKKDATEKAKLDNNIQVATIEAHSSLAVANMRNNSQSGEDNSEQAEENYNKYIDNIQKQNAKVNEVGKNNYDSINKNRLAENKLAMEKEKMENDLKIARQKKKS